jgi:hypothetical protein
MKCAVVAVARRLAVVMHCMWMDDTEFSPDKARPSGMKKTEGRNQEL